MSYKVSVVIEHDENGYYAWCPELPGCQTQGDTLDDVLSHAREAVELYLETLPQDERSACLSKEILTTSLEVSIAQAAAIPPVRGRSAAVARRI